MQYTPEQEAAIKTRAPAICVDAGAGSGKTRVLIDRIVHLIEADGVDLGHVVAITFTDRAAAEMKERLRRAFHQRATDDREGMDRWRRLERQAEHARISTIHTFCGALLRENALHLGLDPEFSVMDENQTALLLDRVIRDTLHRLLEGRDEGVLKLTDEFPVHRIIGTLGTMLRRRFLLDRVAADLPAEDPGALMASWEEAVAQRMQEQTRIAAADPAARRFEADFRAYADECTAEDDRQGVNVRTAKGFLVRLLSDEDAGPLADAVAPCKSLSLQGGSAKNWPSKEYLAEVKARIGEFRDWVKKRFREYEASPEVIARSAELTVELFQVYRKVEEALAAEKARLGAMSFDDIILHALHALRDNESLRIQVARSIQFLLIDEFQDTDGIQLELAEWLTRVEGGPSLFIVGDAKQSIYYFRGAEVEVFAAQRDASEKVVSMRRNFRTQAGIVAFINAFFEKSGILHEVEPEYGAMEAHRTGLGPRRVAFLMPELEEGRASASELREAEAGLVARQIKAMCGGGVQVEDDASGETRPAGYGDVAILFRGMSHVEVYEAALRREGVPYALVAGGGFYTRQEIVDAVNLLKVVVDPWDEAALLGVLRSPLAALTDDDITALALEGGLAATFYGDGVPEFLGDALALADARALLAELRARQHRPLCDFLQEMLDVTQYEAVLLNQYLGLQKASNLRKLVTLGAEFAQTRTPTLREFVHFLESIRAQDVVREGEALLQPEDRGAVTIMTIHKSKGLEFPVVVLPELGIAPRSGFPDDLLLHRRLGAALRVLGGEGETELPPMGRMIEDTVKGEEEEERARLLYVAMTRARDFLVLSSTAKPGKSSYMSLFNETFRLEDRNHGEVVGDGSGHWEAEVLRAVPGAAKADRVPDAPLTPWPEAAAALEAPVVSGRGGTVSISRLLDLLTAPDGDAEDEMLPPTDEGAAPVARAGGIGLLRGAMVHRMLEVWNGDGPAPVDRVLREHAPPLSLRHRLAEDLAAVAEKLAALPEAQRLWADGCQREVPFVMPLGAAQLSGIVDAVLDDHTIVDFKTGRFDEERHRRYAWQLRLYALALARCRGVEAPEGWLVYVDEGRVERVPFDGDGGRAAEAAAKAALERAEA